MSKELVRAARIFHDHARPIHLRRQLFDLAHHHAADALLSQVARHVNVVDAQSVRGEIDRHQRDDVPEELSDQTNDRPDGRLVLLLTQKLTDRLGIRRVDGAYEKAKSAHLKWPKCLPRMLLQHIPTSK
ncbi:MAG TPA: hypothetical protein VEU30_08585 [Thermoanaerobaculia bacterium]|nr:hypothetical protein [Thermoanaerobaculia bacterium]